MTRPRSEQILPGQPGFYHCISRCVRRSWLCGFDPHTGRDFSHRRGWIVERMRLLTSCFAVDVYAYAVMSNHTHIVLYVDPERNETVPDKEIIRRWKLLWNWRHPENRLKLPANVPAGTLETWRERLGDVSWFMRMLNEPLARIANVEDGCKGHFWESRFKSLPLLDEAAVVACMAYVDLNPIKAGVAETVQESDYTSIQARIRNLLADSPNRNAVGPIFPTREIEHHSDEDRLGVTAQSYIELVDSTAVQLKRGVSWNSHPTLNRLGLSPSGWMQSAMTFMSMFKTAAGSSESFMSYMEATGRVRRVEASSRNTLYRT